ncbi:MAG: STAS domain-containing protein [Chloroflexota bacterium]|nr:STAS domain-containing protein [Chloroflexota bacterium]
MENLETTETSTIQKLESLLLVAVPRDLTDNDVLLLRRQVLENVRRYHSAWVLLDFSRVDICDSFFGRFIQSTAKMASLMGARVVVSGLQDAVIETMVELGMILPNVHAVLDLDDALALSRDDRSDIVSVDEQVSQSANLQDEGLAGEQGWDTHHTDALFDDSPFSDLIEV